mgnify:CR=1 FL=1
MPAQARRGGADRLQFARAGPSPLRRLRLKRSIGCHSNARRDLRFRAFARDYSQGLSPRSADIGRSETSINGAAANIVITADPCTSCVSRTSKACPGREQQNRSRLLRSCGARASAPTGNADSCAYSCRVCLMAHRTWLGRCNCARPPGGMSFNRARFGSHVSRVARMLRRDHRFHNVPTRDQGS